MNKTRTVTALASLALFAGACKTTGGGGGGNAPSTGTPILLNGGPPTGPAVSSTTPAGDNVMAVTVNGSQCGPQQVLNQPCVSVKVCVHGTTNCQTITNLLLDTGSSGLRVFASALTLPLSAVGVSGGGLAECVSFADNSSEWGQVAYADVTLANEPAVQVPIQLINATYATPPAACSSVNSNPDTSPAAQGFNGILGVGLFNLDCDSCVSNARGSSYYSCTGTSCTAVATQVQVQNPVALLPVDNNGVILNLPSVPPNGAASADGYLLLGIGTQTNNKPAGLTVYPTDANGNIHTLFTPFNTAPIASFIDSGSNELVIPTIAALPACTDLPGQLCPTTPQNLSATNTAASGTPSGVVTFEIISADTLAPTNNPVLATIGAAGAADITGEFDWGLPFFYGRSVVVGLEGKSSTFGSGMYWAY